MGLGVHVPVDDQPAIVREAQKTGIAAFRNFPHFGANGFATALENVGELLESRNRLFIPAAKGLHPSQYLEELPAIGSFDSLSLQAAKTVALRGTASLQLQVFD